MSQREIPAERVGQRDDPRVDQGRTELKKAFDHSDRGRPRRRVVSLVAGSVACVFAVVLLVGGGWALWKDRVDRDANGFVSIGSTSLRTETYAIVGDLHGDGPSWLWESAVLGDSRVRATSQSRQPLFIGIARTDDLFRHLRGAGYATIDSFEVSSDTTHRGGPPSGPPSRDSIWAASTQGTGQQTLQWDSRSGDWSIVFMNADAGAGVAVHGNASAKLPILPWVAVGLLVAAALLGLVGGWVLVRAIRRKSEPAPSEPDNSQGSTTPGTPRDFRADGRGGDEEVLSESTAEQVNGMTQATTSTEKIDVKGGHLVEKVKELVHEGNVRRIIIKDSDAKTVIEVPMTVGVLGFLAAPTMVAVGALAALAADYSIEVERDTPEFAEPGDAPSA